MSDLAAYEFGPYRVEASTRRLLRGDELVPLAPKAFDILLALVERRDRVVDKAELMKIVWPDSFVEEANLSQTIFVLRKTLGDAADGGQYIETVPRRGYRFVAEVRAIAAAKETVGPPASPPQTSYRRKTWWAIAAGAAVLLVVAWRWSATSDAPIRSIAVLPLANLSGQASEQYFADGLTDALLSDLAQIEALRVVARTSTLRYRDTAKPSADVGRELGVDGLVTGSVVRSGQRVRINIQLIHAASDRHVWARDYERQLSDVLDLQREIARTVADEVRAVLTPEERTRLSRTRVVEPRALDEYLKGSFEFNKRTREGFLAAVAHFEKATAIDPAFATAYSGLADAYTLLVGFLHAAPRVAIPKAESAAMKALELNPDLGDAYVSLGYIRFRYDYDWPRGEEAFKRAIALNPSSELAHHWYALSLGWADRPADARVEIERALLLDPLSTATLTSSALIHYSARQFDQAIAVFDRVLTIEPNNIVAFRRRGWAYQMLGRHAEAVASFERASALSGRDFIELASLGRGYAMAGRPADARQIIDEMRKRDPSGDLTAYSIAEVFAALGDADNALRWLDRAHAARSIWFIFLKTEPLFDALRKDPRFQELVDRIKW
jgi:TolB-like protein/DNA-binding winged helix-turn-helix (wHTH) protein/Tfp pilus assembly protein PilF